MIAQRNEAITIASTNPSLDLSNLFPCPYDSVISPDADQARSHTLDWLGAAKIIVTEAQRAYVDAMRLDLYAARCAPSLQGAELNLFSDWIVYATLLDDHLGSENPDAILPAVHQMVSIFDYDDPDHLAPGSDVFIGALAELWRRCQHIPQPWRRQLADMWAQWLESYLTEATWRGKHLWPSLSRHRDHVRVTSAALAFSRMSEHLGGVYLADHLLNSTALVEMRATVPHHTMAVNDVFGARREAEAGDYLNSVFIAEHEYGCTRKQAVHLIVEHANATLRHFQRLEQSLPGIARDLDAKPDEIDQMSWMAHGLRHWFSGNLAWHMYDTGRYASPMQPLGEPGGTDEAQAGRRIADSHGHQQRPQTPGSVRRSVRLPRR